MSLQTGQSVRLWLLLLVATWRVLLLWFFMGRGAGFSGVRRVVATLFPLTLMVAVLTAMNLEKVVFNIMGGIVSREQQSVNDDAYSVLFLITFVCFWAFFPLALAYLGMSATTLRRKWAKGRESGGGTARPVTADETRHV